MENIEQTTATVQHIIIYLYQADKFDL